MLKGHIRQTENVRRFLARLDELLDQTDTQGGTPNGKTENEAVG